MTFVLGLLATTAVIVSIVLMVVILLQEPKGGGLAAALGGSGMEAIGVNTGSVNKFTAWLAGIWVGACFLHAVLMPLGVTVTAGEADGGAGSSDTPADTTPADTGGDGDEAPK